MSDDSTQLSVAELLARNGQGAPSSGGGRRRRSGRGIAVNELTGDLPVVREGSSSHAAPDPAGHDAPQASDMPGDYSPQSGPITFYNPLASSSTSVSEAPGYDSSGFVPRSFESPGYESGSPAYGSGNQSSDYGSPNYERSYQAPSVPDAAPPTWASPAEPAEPGRGDPFAGPSGPQPVPGGRRARRELAESLAAQEVPPVDPYGSPEPPAPGRGGRRRRRDTDEEATEVQPFRGPYPVGPDPLAPAPSAWAPSRPPTSEPLPLPRRDRAPERGEPGPPARPPQRHNGADGPPPPGLPAWSARRRPASDFAPPGDRNGMDRNGMDRNGMDRNGMDVGRNGSEPVRNSADAGPTMAWSLASQDQQLLAGPTVAGDLLRDEAEREARRGGARPRPSDRAARRDSRPVTDLLAVDENGLTEIYPAVVPELDADDDDFDLDYDDDVLEFDEDEDEDDDDFDELPARRSRRAASRSVRTSSLSARSKALLGGGGRPEWLSLGGGEDTGKKQWLILAGQVVGAAVAGMLLFKGFEKMWDVLPFVALALAVVVILGLVALVRVLRRTDDMYSTVIAVVVGIFVTLGPLAFLLSTN